MHLGNFLKEELKRQRIPIAEVAILMKKSDTAIRKDLKKETLHCSTVNSFQKILKVNIYQHLANELDKEEYRVPEGNNSEAKDADLKNPSLDQNLSSIDVVSLNIVVPKHKKEQILKLLIG